MQGFPDGSGGKESCLPIRETQFRSLGRQDPVEKGMATHSSVLGWRLPWTEEPGGLPSMGLHKSDRTIILTCFNGMTQRVRNLPAVQETQETRV